MDYALKIHNNPQKKHEFIDIPDYPKIYRLLKYPQYSRNFIQNLYRFFWSSVDKEGFFTSMVRRSISTGVCRFTNAHIHSPAGGFGGGILHQMANNKVHKLATVMLTVVFDLIIYMLV